MRESRNFCQGGSRSDLFNRSQMVNFKEIYHFSRFQRGSNIFQGGGGVQLFPGGSNCLFPIETQITCDFPGGDPLSLLLDPHLTLTNVPQSSSSDLSPQSSSPSHFQAAAIHSPLRHMNSTSLWQVSITVNVNFKWLGITRKISSFFLERIGRVHTNGLAQFFSLHAV